MGIVQRTGTTITILSYVGAVIGYVNKILLFTNFLKPDEVGLANILINVSVIYAQFSSLGLVHITLKFFPFFRDPEKKHHGFLFWGTAFVTVGFILVTLLFFIFKNPILDYYSQNSPLLVEYYLYLIPVGLATVYYNFLEAYLRSLFKTVYATLVNEVILRLFVTLSISLYALHFVNFPQFVQVYVALNCSAFILLMIYMLFIKQFFFQPVLSSISRRLYKIIFVFGFYSILSNISNAFLMNIDALMVAGMIGLGETGIYITMFFISTIMIIPYRSILKICNPLVVQYWKNRELDKMDELYKKVSLVNLIIGSLIFILLWVNLNNIFAFMPAEYSQGKYVFLFLSLGRLFDMTTGLNGTILATSKKYRYDVIFTLLLIFLTVGMNLILIPRYGMEGAATATAITIIIYNMARIIFVQTSFKMQPFHFKFIWVIVIGGATLFILHHIPYVVNVYFDIAARTAATSILFMIPLLLLKLSPDVNDFVWNFMGVKKR